MLNSGIYLLLLEADIPKAVIQEKIERVRDREKRLGGNKYFWAQEHVDFLLLPKRRHLSR